MFAATLFFGIEGWGQTAFPLSTSNYFQDFTNIANVANWTNNFASAGTDDNYYRVSNSVVTSTVNTNIVFTSGTAGGVQVGVSNIILLATGTNSSAFDLLLDFTSRNAGTISFDWSKVTNTINATPRTSDLKIQYSLDNGISFFDLTGYVFPRVNNNNTLESGSLTSIALPATFNNSSTIVIRFYCWNNGQTGGAGNRPKISVDNLSITSTSTAPAPEINLLGNSTSIINNDITPSITDNTDFSATSVSGGTIAKIFTIENTGNANLNLTAALPYIVISGTNAADFTLTTNPTTPVAAAGNTTFTITFDPSALGTRNASISIANDDADENPYTFAIQGTGVNSSSSDIIADATYTYSSNIDYTAFQGAPASSTGNSVGVFKFTIRDGAGAADADALGTELTAITFNVTNIANIRSAVLFGGASQSTFISNTATINVGLGTITFTGLSNAALAVADGGTVDVTLRVSFLNTVIDNQQLQYTISSASANTTGSVFATINAGGSTSSIIGDINRIEVTADRLAFLQQPTTTSANVSMAPSVTIRAVDVNTNIDIDYIGSIAITSTGSLTGSPVSINALAGIATYNSLTHTIAGTGFALTGTSTGLVFSNSITSTNFDITSLVFPNGAYRSTSSGTLTLAGTTPGGSATWESYSTVTNMWSSAAIAPNLATVTTYIYIYHSIEIPVGTSSYGGADFSVMATGLLTLNSTNPQTARNLHVFGGGVVNDNVKITILASGNFELENNATFNFNVSSSLSQNSSIIWNGIEKFHPNSNFVIKNHGSFTADLFIPTDNDVSEYTNTSTGYKAMFGNLIYDCTLQTEGFQIFPPVASTKNLTHNDFILRSGAGTNVVKLASEDLVTTIGHDLVLDFGFTGRNFGVYTTAATAVVNVKGSIIHNSPAQFRLMSSSTTSNVTINVDSNVVLGFTGLLTFNASTVGSTHSSTLKLKGDLFVASSAYITNANTLVKGNLIFNGIGDGSTNDKTQVVNIASTNANRNQYINFNISTGAYVRLGADLELGINSKLTDSTGATLDFGFNGSTALNITNYAIGTAFESRQASILKITSSEGLFGNWNTTVFPLVTQTTGNLRIPKSSRNIDNEAIFWYIGKADQQTGDAINANNTAGSYSTTANGKVVICDLNADNLILTPSVSFGVTNGTNVSTTGGKLDIRKGQFFETTSEYIFGSTGTLYMAANTYYKIPKGNSSLALSSGDAVPRMDGSSLPYIITGGTIDLTGTAALDGFQTLRGSRTYANLSFTNGGFKYVSSAITGTNYIKGTVLVADATVLNLENNTFGDASISSGNATNITMTGTSRYINGGAGSKPDAVGVYALGTNTTIEFNSTSATNIRLGSTPINYANIIVSGTNVSNTSTTTGILFQNTGTFLVKNGATFNLASTAGFSGSAVTSINNTNIPSITLEPTSTINYYDATQTITNTAVTSPATGNYFNLTLSGTGSKIAPSSSLVILGNLSKTTAATFAHNEGTVSFEGTDAATQTYSCVAPTMEFNKLVNKNTNGGVTIAGDLGVEDLLTLNPLSKTIFGSGNIHLRSSANKTAAVDKLNSNVNINYGGAGKFFVERFIPSGRKWRFLSAPVISTQTIRESWMENAVNITDNPKPGYGTIVTDEGVNAVSLGFDSRSVSGPSLKYYVASINGYNGIATPAIGLNTAQAYMTFVRGDRSCLASNTTLASTILRARGQLYTQLQTTAGIPIGEFKAIGNPYASKISLKSIYLASTISPNIYVWDPKLTGAYGLGGFQTLTYIGSNFIIVPGSGSYGVAGSIMDSIQSGQAFFVRAAGSVGQVNINEADKLLGSGNVFRGGNANAEMQSITALLSITDVSGNNTLVDGTSVFFNENANNNIDYTDAKKIANTSENVSVKRNNNLLAIEDRLEIIDKDSIPLNITGLRIANYQWKISSINLDLVGRKAFLVDHYLQTTTPINLANEQTFNFYVINTPASSAANRFTIIFKQLPIPTFINIVANINADKTIAIKWDIANENEIIKYEIERSRDGNAFESINSKLPLLNNNNTANFAILDAQPLPSDNFYRIKMFFENGTSIFSKTVKVDKITEKVEIAIVPNVITNKIVNVQLLNKSKGKYIATIFNSLGEKLIQTSFNVLSYSVQEKIKVDKLSSGIYTLTLIDENGIQTSSSFIIQ